MYSGLDEFSFIWPIGIENKKIVILPSRTYQKTGNIYMMRLYIYLHGFINYAEQ